MMDPEACLKAAEQYVQAAKEAAQMGADFSTHIEEVEEHLTYYRTWRRNGGFEPLNGDKRVSNILNHILVLPKN